MLAVHQNNQNIFSKKIKKKIIKKIFSFKNIAIATVIGLVIFAFIYTIIFLQLLIGGVSTPENEFLGGAKALSPEVLQWQPLVEKYTEMYGVPHLTQIVLAVMQVESGGKVPDLMQSSESLGLPVNTLTEEASIRQGVIYLKQAFDNASIYGIEDDFLAIMQAYNFGLSYIPFLGARGLNHNIDIAEEYSRTVVAPSLGNTTGITVPYVNDVSTSFGKPYRYLNGGNFFYAYLVQQYIGGVAKDPIEFFEAIRVEMEKYIGWEYVWGGRNPQTGFDCSGLTEYLYTNFANVRLNGTASMQYNQTVPISFEEARAGDLIFFRGTYGSPNHVSHVGIYINETTMFDSNSEGVGYTVWNNNYWRQFSPEVRRVRQ